MKFHDDRCKGKAVMRRKPKCGRTDGHGDSSITPLTSLRGGINRNTYMHISFKGQFILLNTHMKNVLFNYKV